MLTLLIVVLIVAAIVGGWGHTQGWGYPGWSPFGAILLVLLLLWVFGYLGPVHAHRWR